MQVLNVNGYHFFKISELEVLKKRLLDLGKKFSLLGSILIAEEGINFSLSGSEEDLENFLKEMWELFQIPPVPVKKSWSVTNPFKRFWVKIKKEIVSMDRPGLALKAKAPYISPEVFKEWLSEGKNFVLIDARKDFEYKMGHFAGAINLGSTHFRDFPERLKALQIDKSTPIVTYCTGGIRCEKAAPFLQELGHQEVYQLDGGILRYFEECGGEFFNGSCFVFDHRAAITPDLKVVDKLNCRSCGVLFERKFGQEDDCGLRLQCPSCVQNELKARL